MVVGALQRRDLLKGATMAVAAQAAGAFAVAQPDGSASKNTGVKQIGKIALEEHFMVPDFVEYFAETYPNISPEIAKMGLAALEDFGDRRIEIMDKHQVDFVVLSLAGPGVQVEKDPARAQKRAKEVNDFL